MQPLLIMDEVESDPEEAECLVQDGWCIGHGADEVCFTFYVKLWNSHREDLEGERIPRWAVRAPDSCIITFINFGIVYGISQYGLSKQIGVTPQEAKNYIDAYFAKMPEIKIFMNKTIEFAHQNGFVVTPFGRKCSIFGINDQNKRVSSFAERAAMNAPLQGGAADIMKRAMNNMHKNLIDGNFKSRILLQVHDEMVIEAPEDEVEKVSILLKKTMENAVNYDVKFIAEVGIGQNWAEAH